MANQLSQIKYIVQLMLENRSFDQMLGFLYPNSPTFEGLTGNESNPDDTGREVTVFKIDSTSPHPYLMPGADPGEGLQKTSYQLFSTDDPTAGATPTNQGFVISFKAAIASDLAMHQSDALSGTDPSEIMGMYDPSMLPVLSALAKGFAVCDHWFASVPTETMPNRAFATAATSQGYVADSSFKILTCQSIFGLLQKNNIDWAIYGYNADPKTRLDYTDTKTAAQTHFGHFRDFQTRAQAGTLPPFTFLEPSWGASGNSQHPNYDVSLGEKLIHDVYTALRSGPGWNETLLVINYDEHGGNYDHVPPPWGATPPDNLVGDGFDFTRFGVRVPAVLVSPLIKAGTIFRVKTGTIDHTSLLKTIEQRWSLPALTARDKAAPGLGDVLTLKTPRTDDPLQDVQIPVSGTPPPNQATPSTIEKLHAAQVANLPLRNNKGTYDQHTPPDLSSSSQIADYIQARTSAWTLHLQRKANAPRRRRRPKLKKK